MNGHSLDADVCPNLKKNSNAPKTHTLKIGNLLVVLRAVWPADRFGTANITLHLTRWRLGNLLQILDSGTNEDGLLSVATETPAQVHAVAISGG